MSDGWGSGGWREEVLEVDLWCEVETGKKTSAHEDRRESFPHITDKALDIQTALKHNNKSATRISWIPHTSQTAKNWFQYLLPLFHTRNHTENHSLRSTLKILTQVNKHNPGYKAVNWMNLAHVCKIWKWLICI